MMYAVSDAINADKAPEEWDNSELMLWAKARVLESVLDGARAVTMAAVDVLRVAYRAHRRWFKNEFRECISAIEKVGSCADLSLYQDMPDEWQVFNGVTLGDLRTLKEAAHRLR